MKRRPLIAPDSATLTPHRVAAPAPGRDYADAHRGDGEALAPAMRSNFEARFGHDFSQVRVHADAHAAASARALGAQAYTIGDDVVFGAGRYAPASTAGQALLAHELAHVVQQARGGDAHDAEARADGAAFRVIQGGSVAPHALGRAPAGVQMKPDGAPVLPSMALPLTLASVELEERESIGKDSPKLAQLAESYRANAGQGGGVRVRLSADLPEEVKNNSATESAKRRDLGARMRAIRDVLQSLGVPGDAIDIRPATAYATSAHGQVSASVSKLGASTPSLEPRGVALQPTNVAPAPAAGLPSLDLELKFGPVTVSLPKEVRAKLPIPLAGAKKLVIELGYEVPAKFSFKITLDGTRFVRVSLKAGAEIDAKSAAATGSAGLQIETTSTVCNAQDPGETRQKIQEAGDKLNKAAKEYEAASGSDKLSTAFDIASAIGEMYDAVDKAKAKCKQVPRATVEFGYKRLLTPGSETDPTKLPPQDYVGVTATFHF